MDEKDSGSRPTHYKHTHSFMTLNDTNAVSLPAFAER